MLAIQKFIKENSNWEKLLSNPPYSLNIKRKDSRIIFKYSQINSDSSLEIVKEARGLILEDNTWKVIAFPFKRFFNYGESNAATIDWNSARVSSKEDGSLIKVYFYNGWKVGTSGTIDAEDAELKAGGYRNFRTLFDVAAKNSNFSFDRLDPHYTYCFELCSPFNQIVCPQMETKLYHIMTRDNRTLQEVEIDIGVEKPKEWDLKSLSDCIDTIKTFDFKQEGFVVRDKSYNRIKIKSEDYLRAHVMGNNGQLSPERIIGLIRQNEISEFISYFPSYKEIFKDIQNKINILKENLEHEAELAHEYIYLPIKEFASYANQSDKSFIWYLVYKQSDFSVKEWIKDRTSKQLAKLIKE